MWTSLGIVGGAVLYGLAFPPYEQAWLAWLALVPLLLLVRGQPPHRAWILGVAYGFACSCAVAGWFGQAIARYFQVTLPLGVSIGALYAVSFWGTAFGAFAWAAAILTERYPRAARLFLIPTVWVTSEIVRGRLLEQPWGLLGYSQHANVGVIQIAAITGVYGVSFLVALGNVVLAEALVMARTVPDVRQGRALLPAAALIVGFWMLGAHVAGHRVPADPSLVRRVAIIQSNVDPAAHWTRAYTDAQLLTHIRATEELPDSWQPDLIVWPENAVPRHLETEPMLAVRLAEIAKRHQAALLFGGPRFEDGHTYNSVTLIAPSGRLGGRYDKQKPMIFAEANPFSVAESDRPLDDPRFFTAGSETGVIPSFVPLGVSICHEILHPELIARSVEAGAQLLVNVANDGWLDTGRGVASRQHFGMAALRAVETRRYLVRAATTGPSGLIDPYGQVVEALPPRTRGSLTVEVTPSTGSTPYLLLGDSFAFLCALTGGWALVRRPHGRRWTARHRPSPVPAN